MNRSQFLKLSGLGAGSLAFPNLALAADGDQIVPYLETLRPDSVWITWWSNTGGNSTVDFGSSPDSLNRSASGSVQLIETGNYYHAVQLTGLSPASSWHYCARSGNASSAIWKFRTPPPLGSKTGHLRVLVLGDNQIISAERRWEKLINRAVAKLEEKFNAPLEDSIDLMLNVGDQVDVGTPNHWRNLHFAYGAAVTPRLASMTTVGNHETYGGDSSLSLYKSLFHYDSFRYAGLANPGGGKTYYAHQQASVLFIHLNSESMPVPAEGAGTAQKEWIRQLVTTAHADPSVDFIVSLVHRPYQAEQYIGDISSWFRSEIMPILAQSEKHVLNIGAHHHLYARGQTRDWPVYHIISGASAWDQFWGQSTERDFDDVQMTIANWAWQLIDFNLASREMLVESFAEANVRFPESERWTSKAYRSRLIDSFHRRLGAPPPSRPAITNPGSGPGNPNRIALPFSLLSSPFSSPAGESLNSSHFQIAVDPAFASLRVDSIRDSINLYGDTGAPLFEPVNTSAGLDILQFTIAANSLPNAKCFARVRHRDSNALWSEWSAPWEFTVEGSASARHSLSLEHAICPPGDDLVIGYERVNLPTADWIGIFRAGATPGTAAPASRQYITDGAGTRTFRIDLPNGEYFAALFENNSTTELAARVPFFIGAQALLATAKPGIESGKALDLSWSSAPGNASDIIAVYPAGVNPSPTTSPAATAPARTPSGSLSIPGLPNGYFYAVLLASASFPVSQRLPFSVGSLNASVSMASSSVKQGSDFSVQFSGGPGIPKDWIGLFNDGGTPGIDPLIAYLYFEGRTSGSVTFKLPSLPAGKYYVAMFTNDSYTEVSNRFSFSITAD